VVESRLPEVRSVEPGDTLLLCRCGQSAQLPDCPAGCAKGLSLKVARARHLLLCCCGRSARLPWCDGSHAPTAPGLREKWRRFSGAQ
jgi:CDGSH-type Zn-finger protein